MEAPPAAFDLVAGKEDYHHAIHEMISMDDFHSSLVIYSYNQYLLLLRNCMYTTLHTTYR